MYQPSIVSACALALLLTACASTPPAPNQYGHHFDYEYQPPPEVSEADARECGERANKEAFDASSEISDTAAVVFGPIGAIVQLTRVKNRLNSTYQGVMQDCLREKGYELGVRDQK